MKKYNNLFDKICTIENFYTAYYNATKGKQHYREVKEIEKDLDGYLKDLLKQVKELTYRVSPYIIFNLYSGGKMREIYKLPMRDRIVQHAIMIYCESIFRESFIIDTYSSIKTRGIHLGLKRLKKALKNEDTKYFMKLDIHKCYPSLDQNILKQKLARKFKDKRLLNLLYTIVDSCDKGVPIRNYTSLYFNNFYFSDFDHWIKEQKGIKYYFRYCDDMVIIHNDKQYLHQLLEEIKHYMSTLSVHLKNNYLISPVDSRSIDFLGFRTDHNNVRIRKRVKQNFIRKVKKIDINNLTKHDINILGSYWGILSHANCRNLWFKYIRVKKFKDLNTKNKK